MSELAKERAAISHITWDDADDTFLKVGCDGIREILAYDELGHGSHEPWVRVVNDDGTTFARIPAYKVSIFYEV